MSKIPDFNTMLEELTVKLKNLKNPSKLNLPEPIIDKKTTRLSWLNVNDFLKIINRPIEHLIKYMKNDRQMNVSLINDVLMIQGKFQKKDLQKIMLEYIARYVKCPVCGNNHTNLIKDTLLRKEKIHCPRCLSKVFI